MRHVLRFHHSWPNFYTLPPPSIKIKTNVYLWSIKELNFLSKQALSDSTSYLIILSGLITTVLIKLQNSFVASAFFACFYYAGIVSKLHHNESSPHEAEAAEADDSLYKTCEHRRCLLTEKQTNSDASGYRLNSVEL